MSWVPTLVMDPPPAEFEALIERRRRLGLDRRDEMWEGVYHLAPAPAPLTRSPDINSRCC
jgi:hypothetical protein